MGVAVQPGDPVESTWGVSSDVLWLAALYSVAVIVYVLLGRTHDVPFVNPDESIYGHLAQGIADGTGFDWRGESTRLFAILYVLLIAPAWVIGSTVTGYAVAKAIGAALLCLVCVPVFLLARKLLGSRLALLAAGLSLAGTWMITAGLLLTENAALPLATAALCALVLAVGAPGSRWFWIALGLVVLTAFARAQLVVLFPVVLLALAVDIGRCGRDWRARASAHRVALIATGAVVGALLVVVLGDSSLLTGSFYGDTKHFALGTGTVTALVHQSVVLVAMAGFAPAAVLLPLAVTRTAWRDDVLGPLLVVLVSATAVLLLQTAWFLDGINATFGIARYTSYVVPLSLVATLVAAGRWREVPRWAWGAPVVLGALMLLGGTTKATFVWELLGAYIVGLPVRALGGSLWVGVALGMLVVGLLALWLLRREGERRGAEAAALAVGLLTLAVLVIQSAGAWVWQRNDLRAWRAGFPAQLGWLDKAAGGPVARLVVVNSHPRWSTVEFFNRDVTRVYALDTARMEGTRGNVCSWTVGANGDAVFGSSCGPAPTRYYLDDPVARLTFYGQTTIAATRGTGRVVAVPGAPAVPRVQALLLMPCDDRTLLRPDGKAMTYGDRVCRPLMSGYFWLDAPATLRLGIQGGKRAHVAQIGNRTWRIPAGHVTPIALPLPAGPSQLELRFNDFELPLGYPDIASAALVTDGRRTDILE